MDQRREFVEFASFEGANISELCRRFGISRTTGYKWLSRFSGDIADLADRSRRPQHHPGRTDRALEAVIVAFRDDHPAWGARKIAHCLERQGIAVPAVSTVHAILQRHGRIEAELGGQRAYVRFEQRSANRLWQMDFKGRVRMAGNTWCHPLTVLDDHSRYSVCLEACGNERGTTVKYFLTRTFRRYGLPDALYVDNGSPWGGGVPGQWTPLKVWLAKLGIEMIHSRPYHPQGRGKIERFHRTLNREVLAAAPLRDLAQASRRFRRWRVIYNTERPHEALDMEVPASRYQVSARAMPRGELNVEYGPDEIIRKVGDTKSYVQFKSKMWKVPKAFQGENLAIRPTSQDGVFQICFAATRIAVIDLNNKEQAEQNV